MGFHWPIFRKPEPAPVRFVVATRQESRKARVARVHTELQLGIAVARLSPEERSAAVRRASFRSDEQKKVRG